jgi:hypothetical protein
MPEQSYLALRWAPDTTPPVPNGPDRRQIASHNGKKVGFIERERIGLKAGAWRWAMWRGAQNVDMRFELGGIEETEEAAKECVTLAYCELLRRAAEGALQRQRGE